MLSNNAGVHLVTAYLDPNPAEKNILTFFFVRRKKCIRDVRSFLRFEHRCIFSEANEVKNNRTLDVEASNSERNESDEDQLQAELK